MTVLLHSYTAVQPEEELPQVPEDDAGQFVFVKGLLLDVAARFNLGVHGDQLEEAGHVASLPLQVASWKFSVKWFKEWGMRQIQNDSILK